MNVPTDRILSVFFAAMKSGYAGGASKSAISELPGSKVIRYKEGDFEVVDCYFITPHSNFSFGTTTIYYKGGAVWMMQYRGAYPKDMTPFLKRALLAAYNESEFVGGRGPEEYTEGDNSGLRYVNNVNPFYRDGCRFSGREEIYHDHSQGSDFKGWHEYNGFLLI